MSADSMASLMSLPPGIEEVIVLGVNVPNVRTHGESNCLGIEPLGIGCSTNAARVFPAGMLCNLDRL